MVRPNSLAEVIKSIPGETWAIVYSYESPRRQRGNWYDRWRYEVINDYLEATSLLGAEPYVVDVDSFVTCKALRRSEIDFVVNLNSGATPISNLGLVPSVSEWYRVPCFPNSSDVILVGERKDICKRFFTPWFQVPRDVQSSDAEKGLVPIISKPKTMGNSQGVTRDIVAGDEWIVEEFIPGYEVTVPVFYDLDREDYIVTQPIVYFPDVPDPENWILSHEQKLKRNIVIDRRLYQLTDEFRSTLRDASRAFQFQSLARFDFRWRVHSPKVDVVRLQDAWFLEINCLPTLRSNVNFLKSLNAHLSESRCDPIESLQGRANADIRSLAYLLAQARGRAYDQIK
jgi:hypothetical protein